jgi:hypothetical protein
LQRLEQTLQAIEACALEPLAGWLFAAECHQRMLELADSHREEALALARGGARLFARLRQAHGEPPDWALVLEEQCCRYGVIWLQEAAGDRIGDQATHLRPLLEQLLQFHPEAPAWIVELGRQLDAATPDEPGLEPEPPAELVPYGFFEPAEGYGGAGAAAAPEVEALPWDQPCQTYGLDGATALVEGAEILQHGLIHQGRWYSDCVQYLPEGWPAAPWIQHQCGYRLQHGADGLALRREPAVAAEPLAGEWAVLNDLVAHRNLAHFMADALPQLLALRQRRQQLPGLRLLLNRQQLPNLGLLQRVLWDGEVVYRDTIGPRPLQVQRLLLQPVGFNGGSGYLGEPRRRWQLALPEFRAGLALLRQRLPEAAAPAVSEGAWVYFWRDLDAPTEAPQGRVFSNHAAFLEALARHGVLILDPGRFEIGALQALVRRCRGMLGIHGAGLANALLAEPGTPVIELRPACGVWRMLEFLGTAAQLNWQVVRCEPSGEGAASSTIPIERVLALLNA